jgi:hypothetical protein
MGWRTHVRGSFACVPLNNHPCDLIGGTTAAGIDLTAAPLDQRSAGLIADEPPQLHHARDWALRQLPIWNCGPRIVG